MHQGVNACIHSNPLEQTLNKLHGLMGEFIVEQGKTNEEFKLKMYHLEMRQDMIRNQINHFDFKLSSMLTNLNEYPISSKGAPKLLRMMKTSSLKPLESLHMDLSRLSL